MRPSPPPPWLKQTSLLPWHPRVAPQIYVPRRIATTSADSPAPVDIPKLIIAPGSSRHNSLPTFLEYAKRVNLTSEKTSYIGTHYEYTSALALMRFGLSLLRIGSKDDAGIDLIGHWVMAPLREPLPVIIQCKARKHSLSPAHVRELEGSFQGTPPDWKNKDVLGLLVTTRKATKGMMEAVGKSEWPMGFVLISREGLVEQFVWNRAASEKGLEGVGVTLRHTPRALIETTTKVADALTAANPSTAKPKKRANKFPGTGTRKDIQLTWMGSPIFPDRKDLAQETVKLMRYIDPEDIHIPVPREYKVFAPDNRMGRPRTHNDAPSPRGGVLKAQRKRAPRKRTSTTVGTAKKPARKATVGTTKLAAKKTATTTAKKAAKTTATASTRMAVRSTAKKTATTTTKKTPKKIAATLAKPTTANSSPPDTNTTPAKRGRPKGSKNKPKPPVDAD